MNQINSIAAVLAALAGVAGSASAHVASPRQAMLIFPPAEAATASGREAIKARIAVVAKAYCSANAAGPSLRNCRRAVAEQLLDGVDQSVEAYLKAHARVDLAQR